MRVGVGEGQRGTSADIRGGEGGGLGVDAEVRGASGGAKRAASGGEMTVDR